MSYKEMSRSAVKASKDADVKFKQMTAAAKLVSNYKTGVIKEMKAIAKYRKEDFETMEARASEWSTAAQYALETAVGAISALSRAKDSCQYALDAAPFRYTPVATGRLDKTKAALEQAQTTYNRMQLELEFTKRIPDDHHICNQCIDRIIEAITY